GDADARQRRREVVEALGEIGLTDIAKLADTNGHRRRAGRPAACIGHEITGEFSFVTRGDTESSYSGRWPCFETSDAPAHIIRKVGLGKFAVIDAVDAAFGLAKYNIRTCRFQALIDFCWVVR